MLWGALLLQAKANCVHAEANVQQAKANEETSHNLLISAPEGIFGKGGTIDLKPDRLQSWYVARDDAANGVSIVASITRMAQESWTSSPSPSSPSKLSS